MPGSAAIIVHDRDKGTRDLRRLLAELGDERPVVTVGLRESHGKPTGKEGGDLTLAEIAIVNEFGSEDGRIPERAAWRGAWTANLDKYQAAMDTIVGEAVQAQDTAGSFKRGLLELGYEVVGDLQEAITAFDDPPNADLTIAIKGFDNPLVHTGRTRQTIDAELDDGRNVRRARVP